MTSASVGGPYRKAKREFVVGQMRTRTWRAAIVPSSEADPLWFQRCGDYWALQERLYGVRLSPFKMLIDKVAGDNDQSGVYVTSAVVVEAILPGERTSDYSRVPVPLNS
jgi:hypothetical protein